MDNDPDCKVHIARSEDMDAVSALDAKITGVPKLAYWQRMFKQYGTRTDRYFLVAEVDGKVAGFIIGEIRAWEFGSPPAGWIFAIGVDPESRQIGIGTHLFKAISKEIRASGVKVVRTMLARDDNLNMSFFRSHGMTGGSFIQLEMPLDQNGDETEAERAEAT